MSIKLSLNEIRFLCMICLPLSRVTHGVMSEAEIIEWAKRSKWPNLEEQSSVRSRSDSRFANKVHNVVCHRSSRKNPIRTGFINWDQPTASFELTEKGRSFLSRVARQLDPSHASEFETINEWLGKLAK